MTKRKIIILMHYMELGGAEMALIGLLQALDPAKVAVDLFIYSHRGPLMKYIPAWVNLLPEKRAYAVIEEPMSTALRHGCLGVVIGRLLAKVAHKEYIRNNPPTGQDASIFSYNGKYVTPCLPKVSDKEYDLCISFLIPHDIGLKKVKARKRIAWIHTDYSRMSVNVSLERYVWSAYDYIASISPAVKDAFLNVFPETRGKIKEIENILSSRFVRERSDTTLELDSFNGSPRLLSVGRYTYAKNYDNLPDIARRLVKDYGMSNLRWYIIGYGDDSLIRAKIREARMENHVILLGKKENPYPYIKACDIYVQPSRYEGKSVTVREAQILCKPVAVTDYPTASSQINDGVDGVIVPLDNDGCAKGLKCLIENQSLQERLTSYLALHNYSNEEEINKIYRILDIEDKSL